MKQPAPIIKPMTNSTMIRFLPAIFFLLCSVSAIAQTATPAQTLRLARATYEQGRLHEIPTQLNQSVIADMNKQEKVEAYKILCLSYIYLEESASADEAMLNILRTDPYFEVDEAIDPAEFVALWHTFRTTPIYRFGAKIGVNASQPNVSESSPVVNLESGSKYKYAVGFMVGGVFEIPIRNDQFTIHGELTYIQKRYTLNLLVDRSVQPEDPTIKNEFEGTETQDWLSIPVTFEYMLWNEKFRKKKFRPYIAAGVSADYLISDEINASRFRTNAAAIKEANFKPERKKLVASAILAAGAKVRIAGGFFVAEVRYTYGLMNVNDEESVYTNYPLLLDYGYADPIFKISSLCITGSYVQNIFKPKKLTRK